MQIQLPLYAKNLAIIFLFVLALCVLGLFVYFVLRGLPIPPIITTLLGALATAALHALGINYQFSTSKDQNP